ncbi:hypothetical protein KC614_01330 [candidate division WWE3 bacterium]|uniref:Uncharacterized protein n=1 Tax=candidate division WWE3 bacterium TaxID=2053526 RepID=A0A955LJW0_UNCKA|nr:hypothetical protein [candidate division WWE3 bacterium]
MAGIIQEYLIVFAVLQLAFGFFEYQYRADIFYVVSRLFTTKKYIVPSLILPIAFIILRRLITFLF